MSSGDNGGERMRDPVARLPAHDPDPRRAARTRARCHAALDGCRPRAADPGVERAFGWRRVHVAVAAASLAYLVDVTLRAVLLHLR